MQLAVVCLFSFSTLNWEGIRPLLLLTSVSSLDGAIQIWLLFSPLGKSADRAIYFTFHKFYLFLIADQLSQIHWTDFHDLCTK